MKKRKVYTLFLIILFVSSVIFGLSKSKEQKIAAADLTSKLNIKNYEVRKNPGGGTTLEEGERVYIRMEFEIDPLPAGTQVGDTFKISLPDSYHFHYNLGSGSLPMNSSDPLLTYQMVGSDVVFTICEAAVDAERLYNGILEMTASAIRQGTNIDGGGNGKGPLLTVTPAPPPQNYPPSDIPYPDETKYLYKSGNQLGGLGAFNTITWSLRANYLGLGEAFDNYAKDQGATKIIEKKNGLLVDHLTPGTHFKEGSLYVTVPTYIVTTPASGSQMGERQIGRDGDLQFNDILIQKEGDTGGAFLRLHPTPGQSYENFKDYVQAYPDLNGGQRVYGIYYHDDGTETVLIGFGTMPGSVHYYDDLRKDFAGSIGIVDIHDAIDADVTLNQGQKDALHDIYGKSNKSPSNGAIMAYDIAFQVDVDVPEFGDGTYYNELEFFYDDDGYEYAGAESLFEANWGNIEADFLKIVKSVAGETGQALSQGKVFEFTISDDRNNTVAYGKTVTAITQKGVEVRIKFYRDQAYTIPIEDLNKADPNHWNKILVENRWYYINEVNADGYEVHIQDTSGNTTNRFKYVSTVEQRWRFFIVNNEPIKIEANKKISGTGNLTKDKEFHFELRDTRTTPGTTVAYGKTKVEKTDGKNVEKKITFYTDNTYTTEITNWKKMTIGGVEQVILEDGVTYELVEVDPQGYEVTYYNDKDAGGNWVKGNTCTIDYEEAKTFSFLVDNKDTFEFGANKKVEGTGNLANQKVFEFQIKDITNAANPIVAYGKATMNQMGVSTAIEFFTTATYQPASKITDWATVLTEGSKYRLIETNNQHYIPKYSGGTGTDDNEFEVVFNDSTKHIELNILNKNSFEFEEDKKVTGTGKFNDETFKFHLLDQTNQIVAYGEAVVNGKNTVVPIDFYKTENDPSSKITDWTKVLTEGATYKLKELDNSGFAVMYTNQAGVDTDSFVATFNTGQALAIHVENIRDQVPLPSTGGDGFGQQIIFGGSLLLLVVGIAVTIEYRRGRVGE